ncbi:MAG: Xylose isomerase-like TIM barrel [Candidatus Hinthialibacteria bacterium OLB16]|nr:MAG: Xylose isomerase-like TIM barrel [Candidatus Hinthialibacteria bacterium OLB16]
MLHAPMPEEFHLAILVSGTINWPLEDDSMKEEALANHNPDMESRRRFLRKFLSVPAVGITLNSLMEASHSKEVPQPPQNQSRWQIGCYTRPWDKYEYLFALDAIAKAGYEHVGLMTTKSFNGLIISHETTLETAHQIGEECRQRGLNPLSAYGGDIPVAASLEAGIEGLKRIIESCAAARVKNLMLGGVTDEKLHAPYYKAISECCDFASEKGIGLSIKPHGGTNSTGPQCRQIIELVNNPNFRLWYDPANILYYSDGQIDPVEDAPSVDGLVVGMSVKDYHHPKEVLLTPGTGQVDFLNVMKKLVSGGFRSGPLIVECLKVGEPETILEEARKALRFTESLTGQLG